jgi:dihydrodipicolinate synthase/N-acetylneuraminate lyase
MSRPPVDGDVMGYFRELAAVVPVVIYDQGVRGELSVADVIAPLARETGNIIAVKVSGIPEKVLEIKQTMNVPALCGWDLMSLLAYEMGADGVISGFAALLPDPEVRLRTSVKEHRLGDAREIFYKECVPILPHVTFDPFGFSAGKWLLHWRGIIRWPIVREPLNHPINRHRIEELKHALERVGALQLQSA